MSLENSENPIPAEDCDNNKKIKYARKVNWEPCEEPEIYHTTVVNYHFGQVQEINRNTGAIPKSRKTTNDNSVDNHPKPATSNTFSDIPSFDQLFDSSKEPPEVGETHSHQEIAANTEHKDSIDSNACKIQKRCCLRNYKTSCDQTDCCMCPSKQKCSNMVAMDKLDGAVPKTSDLNEASVEIDENKDVNKKTYTSPPKRQITEITGETSKRIDHCEMRPTPTERKIMKENADVCCYFCNKKIRNPVNVKVQRQEQSPKEPTFIIINNDEASEGSEQTANKQFSKRPQNLLNTNPLSQLDSNVVNNSQPIAEKQVVQASNVTLLQDILQHKSHLMKGTYPSNQSVSAPIAKPKPKAPVQNSFKQRQQELHRYRIAVEQKRLELLETKLARERDEMAREQILFDKELELKEVQIHQFKEDRDN